MNNQRLQIKPIAIAFGLYLVMTVLLSIVLTTIWQSNLPQTPVDQQQLMQMAATSEFLNVGSALVGCFAGIICAFFITRKTIENGYKYAFYLGGCFILYGLLSIYLHPEHTASQQLGKVLSPIPLCLVGAWFALKFSSKRVNQVQSA